MLPAVAVRQFVPRYARIIDANDQAPPGHLIRTTMNTCAGSGHGAGRLAPPNDVAGREHDLKAVCPLQELLRRLQHTKAARSLRDMKIGRRNTGRGRHLVRPAIAGDTGDRRRNQYGRRQFAKCYVAEPSWSASQSASPP
jgi:hypothetical protein